MGTGMSSSAEHANLKLFKITVGSAKAVAAAAGEACKELPIVPDPEAAAEQPAGSLKYARAV